MEWCCLEVCWRGISCVCRCELRVLCPRGLYPYQSLLASSWCLLCEFYSILDESIIVTLEYTSSNNVNIFNHLSDPQEPLINQISSKISSDTSSGLVDGCFIFICMHGFPVCIPSFCKQGKPLKHKHQLLRKLLWRWNLCQPYMNYPPALLHTNVYLQWITCWAAVQWACPGLTEYFPGGWWCMQCLCGWLWMHTWGIQWHKGMEFFSYSLSPCQKLVTVL